VLDAHLRRVEDVNGAIKAVVQVDAERTLVRAMSARSSARARPTARLRAASAGTAARHDERAVRDRPDRFTTPHSLTGWPAATVRCATSHEGLPIDVQLVARRWRDDVALAAALRLERELGGWRPPRGVEARSETTSPVP
jgi:amidase